MKRSARPAIAFLVAALLLAAGSAGDGAGAQGGSAGGDTVRIEMRVWQALDDDLRVSVGARPQDGSWETLGVTALPLDDGHSSGGHYRYGDATLAVPLSNRATPAHIEMRVWQDVENARRIYLSARPRGGSWEALGTILLPLDDGVDSVRGLRYGDARIDAPLPEDDVSTLAGRAGLPGYVDGPSDEALFGQWAGGLGLDVAVDRDGSVVVSDLQNLAIRLIAPDGTVTTIAGGNGRGVRDGHASVAQFAGPRGLAVAPDGTIYVADYFGHRIRAVAPDGTVTTVAGGGPIYAPPYGEGAWGSVRDGPAAEARLKFPHGIALDPDGNLFVAEDYGRIRRISPSGDVSTYAGGERGGYRDGPREGAGFYNLLAIDTDDEGKVYVIDNHYEDGIAIRKIDTAGVVSTLRRGSAPERGGTLASPRGLAVTDDGVIYISNAGRHQILELTPGGILRAVAGTGERGYADGPRASAMFDLPGGLDVSGDGRLVVADTGNNVIRAIAPGGTGSRARSELLPVAGRLPRLEGVAVTVFSRAPLLSRPGGMALGAEGNVIVADSGRHAIGRISADGTVTTIAGGNGEGLRDAVGGEARFSGPQGVAVHGDGSVYVADSGNNRIRRIAPDGTVTTVAGGGPPAAVGNWGGYRDGPAEDARFRGPSALAFDGAGNLVVVDTGNSRIRLLSPDGEVSTLAGAAPTPAPGDRSQENSGSRDGPGPEALFHAPRGIALGPDGNIFFAEGNHAIRMIDGGGFVSTVLRSPSARYGGALSSSLGGIARGSDGALYVIDYGYDRVTRVTRDGEVSIVTDLRVNTSLGILVTADGDLLVSDSDRGLIWKITLGGESGTAAE